MVSINVTKEVDVDVAIDLDDIIESIDEYDLRKIMDAKGVSTNEVDGADEAGAEIRCGHLADAIRIISRADDRLRDLEYLYHKVHGA